MKLSLIVLAGLAVSIALRHRSAALRHWVLATTVICAGAVPLLETVVPAWRLPIGTPAAFESYDGGWLASSSAAAAPTNSPSTSAAIGRSQAPREARGHFDTTGFLSLAWFSGIAIGLGILVVGFLRLWWVTAHARRVVGGRWIELTAQVSRELGLRRPVVLFESAHPSLLVTWGLARPKVILPAGAAGWTEDRARVVLTHEIAHIRRGDWAVQISAELLRAVYWFNPLVWVACRRLRLESEHACDDEVMSRGVRAPDYASHLVDLARTFNQRRHLWLPAPAMARPSSLERRVRAMLNDRLNRGPLSGAARVLIAASLLVITIAVAAAQSTFVSFTGSVFDEQRGSIASATVVLVNEQRRMKYEVTTNEMGEFEFVGLPAGDYRVEVKAIGFKTQTDAVKIAAQNLRRDLQLEIGTLQETITVTFDPAETADRDTPARPVREVAMPARKECIPTAFGGRIVPPRKVRDVSPRYPDALRGTGTEGVVQMEARIGTDGYVADIRLVGDANAELAQSAMAAVRDWRFTETLLNCTPVEVTMMVTTTFRRQSPPPPPPPPPAPRP